MGLFDFFRGHGKKVYDKEEEAPEKSKAQIEADNPGVKDLKVDYQDGKVSLSGTADSPEAMEKAVLLAGNKEICDERQSPYRNSPQVS